MRYEVQGTLCLTAVIVVAASTNPMSDDDGVSFHHVFHGACTIDAPLTVDSLSSMKNEKKRHSNGSLHSI